MAKDRKAGRRARNVARNARTKSLKRQLNTVELMASMMAIAPNFRRDMKAAVGRMFRGKSRRKPHQGAQEMARRFAKGQTDNAIEHADRWAYWKTGRVVHVDRDHGIVAACIPSPDEQFKGLTPEQIEVQMVG